MPKSKHQNTILHLENYIKQKVDVTTMELVQLACQVDTSLTESNASNIVTRVLNKGMLNGFIEKKAQGRYRFTNKPVVIPPKKEDGIIPYVNNNLIKAIEQFTKDLKGQTLNIVESGNRDIDYLKGLAPRLKELENYIKSYDNKN